MSVRRVTGAALAGAVLIAALAGCGGRADARPGPAPGASGGGSTLTSQDVATVEQTVRDAGSTLDDADQALAGD